MNLEQFKAQKHDGPVPGQAFTKPRRSHPFDRPPEHAQAGELLEKLFVRLSEEETAGKFLALIDAGVPMEDVIEVTIQSLFGEGVISVTAIHILAVPLTVMMMRMAEAAGIDPVLNSDNKKIKMPEVMLKLKNGKVSKNAVQKAIDAVSKSSPEITNLPKREGLMKRPEAIV